MELAGPLASRLMSLPLSSYLSLMALGVLAAALLPSVHSWHVCSALPLPSTVTLWSCLWGLSILPMAGHMATLVLPSALCMFGSCLSHNLRAPGSSVSKHEL